VQVVILCGGKGTRIRDVAEDIPKPMIPIGGRPILWHIMKGYAQYGLKDFVLCLGYKSWVIKQYFLNYGLASADVSLDLRSSKPVTMQGPFLPEDWRVVLAETGEETMTGGRVKLIERYITGSHFLLTYGDGLADLDLRSLLAFHRQQGKIGTVTAVQPPGRFGEIELKGNSVAEFNEKPLLSRGRISGGFFVFQRRFLERLSNAPDLILEKEPLIHLARDGELAAHTHDGFWHCMDSSRDYQFLNELWTRGTAPWKTWEEASPLRAAG
jgi:glucose-1-phosphate cytidylyltransferase